MEQNAPFNSALDLLERLSNILSHMVKIKQSTLLNKDQKQEYILELLKDYYIQSIPILSEKARKEFESVLDLEQETAKVVSNGKVTQEVRKIYSNKVEKEINIAFIGIQKDLQDVGSYFMPRRNDPSRAVSRFN